MAPIAALRIIQSLDRMDIDKIAAMAFGDIIPAKGSYSEIRIYPTALVTIETERLIVALRAVSARLACQDAVAACPVTVMVGRYSFTLVAAVALDNLHVGVFLV